MKCAMCSSLCGYGAIAITIISDQADTVNLCTRCRMQLLGRETDERVRRLVRAHGWVQPPLPLDFRR